MISASSSYSTVLILLMQDMALVVKIVFYDILTFISRKEFLHIPVGSLMFLVMIGYLLSSLTFAVFAVCVTFLLSNGTIVLTRLLNNNVAEVGCSKSLMMRESKVILNKCPYHFRKTFFKVVLTICIVLSTCPFD